MNTVLGLLGKGDQNCYLQEEQKPRDIFGNTIGAEQPENGEEQAEPRDVNNLPNGVVQTAAEKAAAEKKAAEAEAQRKAEEEQRRLEEEERRRQEEERKKKPGIASKMIKWLNELTKPEEE